MDTQYCYHSTNARSAADGLCHYLTRNGIDGAAIRAAESIARSAAQGHNARAVNYANAVARAVLAGNRAAALSIVE